MNEENTNISSKTWFRTIEPINKAGYMNGASAGQTDSFQSSFNIGYSQGCKIGFELGYNAAVASLHQGNNNDVLLRDPRRINCQLCLNGVMLQEKVDNLHNIQEERNREYLQMA